MACADLVIEKAQQAAEKYQIAQACTVDELLDNEAIDIVVNLTIPQAHAEVTTKALTKGKHVFEEKPLAVTTEEGKALLDLSEQQRLHLCCAPDTFLGAGYQTARKIIDDGWIGEVVGVSAFMGYGGPESWHPNPAFLYKTGAGPLLDIGPYYLTALVSLFAPIKSTAGLAKMTFSKRTITSQPLYGEEITVEEPTHVNALLQFQSGVQAQLTTSFDVAGTTLPNIEVYGTLGTLILPDPNTMEGRSRSSTRNRMPGVSFPCSMGIRPTRGDWLFPTLQQPFWGREVQELMPGWPCMFLKQCMVSKLLQIRAPSIPLRVHVNVLNLLDWVCSMESFDRRRNNMEIGLQVFSIRKALQEDFYGTLEKVAQIGYKYIEFANHHADTDDGIGFNIPAHTLKSFLDAHSLKPISCHAGPLDEKNIHRVIEYHQELGNNSLGLSIGFWPNKEAVVAFAKKLNTLGEIVTKAGMNFYYHNHFMEFQKFGEKSVFEHFLELTDKEYVKFEFDLYWALRGGLAKPENYLDVLGRRCDLIHQKDIPTSVKHVNILSELAEVKRLPSRSSRTTRRWNTSVKSLRCDGYSQYCCQGKRA